MNTISLIAVLSLVTLMSFGIFALVSKWRVDQRRSDGSTSKSSLATDSRGEGAIEALERADTSGRRGTTRD